MVDQADAARKVYDEATRENLIQMNAEYVEWRDTIYGTIIPVVPFVAGCILLVACKMIVDSSFYSLGIIVSLTSALVAISVVITVAALSRLSNQRVYLDTVSLMYAIKHLDMDSTKIPPAMYNSSQNIQPHTLLRSSTGVLNVMYNRVLHMSLILVLLGAYLFRHRIMNVILPKRLITEKIMELSPPALKSAT